jgi:signal transduction histidine kinase
LYRFEDQNIKAGAVANGVVFRAPDAFGKQPIWALYPDQETIWAGTFRGGLLRFRNGTFFRYATEQGLPNDVICQILPDHQGNLWLGTYGGIFRVAKVELNACARGQADAIAWVTYGRLAGLPTLECSGGYQPSGWPGADGRLWFATMKGVVSVQPDSLAKNRLVPQVLIEEVVVDGRTTDMTKAGFAPGRETNLEIGPGKHYVEFHYTGLSFTAPEQVRFRYRLRGMDDRWVEAGSRRFAQYTFLKPGDYHFEVMACNNEGLWNVQAGALLLRLQPHFWETWWFRLSLGILLVGLLAVTVRQVATRKLRRQMERLEQQQAVERDRARIAKDIHDDLGAGLTQIGLLTELSRRAPPEALDGRLNQISETTRELTGAMDEIVWAVNPRNDTLDGLAVYLCKFGQEFLSVAGIRCRLDVPVQLPARSLNAETRHNLFLAIKEALNNVVKHSRATEVWLKLVPGPAMCTIIIQDNGRGFPFNGEPMAANGNGRIAGGNGLPNLAKRLQNIGGRATVTSTPGQGVTVELTAPFASAHPSSLVKPSPGAVQPSSPPASNN